MISGCSCDVFCDDPCPVHARENALQNEVITLRAALAAEREAHAETKREREKAEAACAEMAAAITRLVHDEGACRCDLEIGGPLCATCSAAALTLPQANPGAALLAERDALRATIATSRAVCFRLSDEDEDDALVSGTEQDALIDTGAAELLALVCRRDTQIADLRKQREKAEAACAEMRGTIPALLRYVEGRAEHEGPYDEGRCVRGAGCAVCDVERAMESAVGSALLAERDALRATVERLERVREAARPFGGCYCPTGPSGNDACGRCNGCRLLDALDALDAAKDGAE